jgi:hypothetical protein
MNGSVHTMVIVGGYALTLFLSIYVCCCVLIIKILVQFTKKGKMWQEEKYKNDQLVGLLQNLIWNQMKCFTFYVVFWPHWDM